MNFKKTQYRFISLVIGLIFCGWLGLSLTSCGSGGDSEVKKDDGHDREQSRAVIIQPVRQGPQRRAALVIGNSAYQSSPLKNPVNDAEAVSSALSDLGFKVIQRLNAGRSEMRSAVYEFSAEIKKGGVGLFYYAGHGLQIDGVNYLVPVDADIRQKFDVEDQCLKARYVLAAMEEAGNDLNIVILDACRDNPYRSFRGGEKGLAKMDAPTGSVVAYATAPGSTADDGPGQNGLYTSSLLRNIYEPDLDLLDFFNKVGYEVMSASNKTQIPWTNHTPVPEFFFADSGAAPVKQVQTSSRPIAVAPPAPVKTASQATSHNSVASPGAAVPAAPSAPQVTVDLDKKVMEREAAVKKWAQWQSQMEVEYNKIKVYENHAALTARDKEAAWASFLSAFSANNEYSAQDEVMRSNAQARQEYWKIKSFQEEQAKIEAEKARLLKESRKLESESLLSALEQEKKLLAEEKARLEEEKRRMLIEAEKKKLEEERLRLEEERRKLAASAITPSFANPAGMRFVRIPAGSFMMGSPSSESGRNEDEKQHGVSVTSDFYMQVNEVTVGQFRRFVKETGYRTEAETDGGAFVLLDGKWQKEPGYYWDNPGFLQTDSHPVTCVSWSDARVFIKWLNGLDNKRRYRLPSEAEWEYAARAGTSTPFAFGQCLSTSQANYDGSHPQEGCAKGVFKKSTVPAGSYGPNYWGLQDMHGNVYEWCEDWYGKYPSGQVKDYTGHTSGSERVVRGGCWSCKASYCRSADRGKSAPSNRYSSLGFRLAADK